MGHHEKVVETVSPVNAGDEKKLVRKQDARIIPLSAGIYFLCFLDRANMGNAKVLNSTESDNMESSLHMSHNQFNVALMTFFISYALLEVPSNFLLKKLRPSRWLAFLMFGWGAMTVSLGSVRSFAAVAGVRFLLGMFEAGLFPGLVYYMTFWYRHDERSVRVATVISSATLAGAFGGAIAYAIGHMNGVRGLEGWRWLFIIEGIPSCVSSFLVFFLLPDYPESASWLSKAEKDLAATRLLHEGSKSSHKTISWADLQETLTDWRLYVHYILYFAVSSPFASLSLFIPSLTANLGFGDLMAQLMVVPPWAVTYSEFVVFNMARTSLWIPNARVLSRYLVCQILVAFSADRFNGRSIHAAGAACVGAAGFAVSAALPPSAYKARYGALFMAASGTFASIPPLLGWLTCNLFSTSSAGLAIAMNVSTGSLAQIVGIFIYKGEEASIGYPTGHWTNAGFLLLVATLSLALRAYYSRENKRLAAEAEERGVEQVRIYKL
ncbi:hypothetical protein CP533_1496 [Ophiocordyceps camponoti-saundersi (nom. inval.)]|nr:hypothetical protein CP533_1496 [Ophiocordyceps camponoti-saundersi (nom. inval.)]